MRQTAAEMLLLEKNLLQKKTKTISPCLNKIQNGAKSTDKKVTVETWDEIQSKLEVTFKMRWNFC